MNVRMSPSNEPRHAVLGLVFPLALVASGCGDSGSQTTMTDAWTPGTLDADVVGGEQADGSSLNDPPAVDGAPVATVVVRRHQRW